MDRRRARHEPIAPALALALLLALAAPAPAQTGLGDPSGGIVVLLLVALVGLAGLAVLAAGGISLLRSGPSFWRVFFFAAGLIAVSPAAWFAYMIFGPEIRRTEHWDFRSSRGTAWMDPKRKRTVEGMDHDLEYSVQGNIGSTILLPKGQWSGDANLVYFRARRGEITLIDWQGRHAGTAEAYRRAKTILDGLELPTAGLDTWYASARGPDRRWFTIESEGTEPMIRVDVRLVSTPNGGPQQEADWFVNVYVEWKGR